MKLKVELETENEGNWRASTEMVGSLGLKRRKKTTAATAARKRRKTLATIHDATFVRLLLLRDLR